MVRGRLDVGVTMSSSEAPLADGAGDDSAVLESNTSPETKTHTVTRESTLTVFRSHALLNPLSCRINLAGYEI